MVVFHRTSTKMNWYSWRHCEFKNVSFLSQVTNIICKQLCRSISLVQRGKLSNEELIKICHAQQGDLLRPLRVEFDTFRFSLLRYTWRNLGRTLSQKYSSLYRNQGKSGTLDVIICNKWSRKKTSKKNLSLFLSQTINFRNFIYY